MKEKLDLFTHCFPSGTVTPFTSTYFLLLLVLCAISNRYFVTVISFPSYTYAKDSWLWFKAHKTFQRKLQILATGRQLQNDDDGGGGGGGSERELSWFCLDIFLSLWSGEVNSSLILQHEGMVKGLLFAHPHPHPHPKPQGLNRFCQPQVWPQWQQFTVHLQQMAIGLKTAESLLLDHKD